MTNAYRERPTVRIAQGWREFYVYDAIGNLVARRGAFHEEGARREVARAFDLSHEDLSAELRERDQA